MWPWLLPGLVTGSRAACLRVHPADLLHLPGPLLHSLSLSLSALVSRKIGNPVARAALVGFLLCAGHIPGTRGSALTEVEIAPAC